MPDVYPDLPGRTYSVFRRPKFMTAPPQVHSSGREVRINYAQYPLWEFELTYSVLRDQPGRDGSTEYRTMLGFFMQQQGNLNGFLFPDPIDNQVERQLFVQTTTASTTYGPLVRSLGAGGFNGTEPVGYVDLTQPFRLYVDDTLVSSSDATWGYTVDQTTPVNQQVVFNSATPTGHTLKVDMSYFYYVRFSDPTLEFEEFMWRLHQLKTVKLESLRG